eukprot:3512392-Rhodomonas_salina.1
MALPVHHSTILGTSVTLMPSMHSATSAIPAFPGRQYSLPRSSDCVSFQQIECSAPHTQHCQIRGAHAKPNCRENVRKKHVRKPQASLEGCAVQSVNAPRPPEPITRTFKFFFSERLILTIRFQERGARWR